MTVQETWDHYRTMPEQDMYDYSPFLREVARGNVLEIGVCQGVSTAAFLLGLDDKDDGHLWSIDIDPKCGDVFRHPRWTFLGGASWNLLPIKDAGTPEFDVLMVDGDHKYDVALGDLCRFAPLVKPGGLILAHDVDPSTEWLPRILRENWYPVDECRKAWKDFCALHPSWPVKILPGMTGLGVMTKAS